MKAAKPKALPRLKYAYYEPKAGEWISPIRRFYRLACCDCGLVHRVDFRVHKGRAEFRVYRLDRATAAMRRKPHNFQLVTPERRKPK
jgi:hypothetical protein